MPSSQPRPPPLLTLPPELRLQIYALVLPRNLRLRFRPHRRTHKTRSWRKLAPLDRTPLTAIPHHKISLLLVSRLLHRETVVLFYGHNTFILEVDHYSFTATLRREVLGLMADVEVEDLNFGRGSKWYQGRVRRVLGTEMVLGSSSGSGSGAGAGVVLAGVRRLTLQLEGTDAFANIRVRGVLGRMVRGLKRGRLEVVVVCCGVGKGRRVREVVDRSLGKGWVRGEEVGGMCLFYRGRFKAGVRVCWVKRKSSGLGTGTGGMVGDGLEGELRDVRLGEQE